MQEITTSILFLLSVSCFLFMFFITLEMIFPISLSRKTIIPSCAIGSRCLSYFLADRAASSLCSPKFLMNCKKCNTICQKRTVQKNTANYGRQFYSCSNTATGCKFFAWADGKPSSLSVVPTRSVSSSSADTTSTVVPLSNTLVIYTDGACIGMKVDTYLHAWRGISFSAF